MHTLNNQTARLKKISDLITQRDQLNEHYQSLIGRVNYFSMVVGEISLLESKQNMHKTVNNVTKAIDKAASAFKSLFSIKERIKLAVKSTLDNFYKAKYTPDYLRDHIRKLNEITELADVVETAIEIAFKPNPVSVVLLVNKLVSIQSQMNIKKYDTKISVLTDEYGKKVFLAASMKTLEKKAKHFLDNHVIVINKIDREINKLRF